MSSIVSYAQNFEDILLFRALRTISGGFYIDVGAGHPTEDSVTRLFSDRGWRGINIEPDPSLYEQLATERTRDINLHCAAGMHRSRMALHIFDQYGLSTLRPDIAAGYRLEGHQIATVDVEVVPLGEIVDRHVNSGQEIHFLKIDVEGHEIDVIRGLDWSKTRPWIVVVEATVPKTQIPSREWEPFLIGKGYLFAFFDGLNCFYVAEERNELLASFNSPANVFDDFVPAKEIQLKLQIDELQKLVNGFESSVSSLSELLSNFREMYAQSESHVLQLEHDLDMSNKELVLLQELLEASRENLADRVREHQTQVLLRKTDQDRIVNLDVLVRDLYFRLQLLHDSTSWKATRPLRAISGFLKSLRDRFVVHQTEDPANAVEDCLSKTDPVGSAIPKPSRAAKILERRLLSTRAEEFR